MSLIWDSQNSGLWYKCAAQSDFYLKLHIANITVQAFWKASAVIIINPISFSCPFVWLCVTGCVTDWLVVRVWVGEWVGEGPYELGVCVWLCVRSSWMPAVCASARHLIFASCVHSVCRFQLSSPHTNTRASMHTLVMSLIHSAIATVSEEAREERGEKQRDIPSYEGVKML